MGCNFGTNIIVIIVDSTHFMKDIRLKEKPCKKHCATLYVRTPKKKTSKIFKLSKKSLKKSVIKRVNSPLHQMACMKELNLVTKLKLKSLLIT